MFDEYIREKVGNLKERGTLNTLVVRIQKRELRFHVHITGWYVIGESDTQRYYEWKKNQRNIV